MTAIRPYLQLLRLPTVFTAMADIFLGFLLARGSFQPVEDFLLLLAASSGLYLAGMVFNDVFDRHVDARERPQRPIPSGRVSVRQAVILGAALGLGGLIAAGWVGLLSLAVAGGLAVSVFAYDALLKRIFPGPAGMGLCRFLNVMLGASVAGSAARLWVPDHWLVALALGVYITGVTWFARREAGASNRLELGAAIAVINLGLAGLGAYVWTRPGTNPRAVVLGLAIVALVIDRRLVEAWIAPRPENVQPAVKTMLLSVIVLDGLLVFFATGNSAHALATVALLLPALLLGRLLAVT